ncbi:nuclease-related domain-containing DEAD/DEAH box helicase [Actinocorallia populi]|uniref:nuclease-related domain-containing DEAD/DEAH box helicase n=1 Tax=Actinocorallia populi TaxID=2079200 RepID=UPI000D093640|nr:UvrD-helicase domain-containing protein [Actinocorallia populi]
MAAGESARWKGRQELRRALRLVRTSPEASREASGTAGRYTAAAGAEERVAKRLSVLGDYGWEGLRDRRWPGTRSANVDLILVGPAGVYVIDVKAWKDVPEIRDGRLHAGSECRDREVDKLLAMTQVVEEQVGLLGMSPVAVRPLMVFEGHRLDLSSGRVRLLGGADVVRELLAQPERVTGPMIGAVVRHLESAFPEYECAEVEEQPADEEEILALFDVEELKESERRAALSAPVEQWMTFLAPDQVSLTRRRWNGPARVSGPAGTGKTVVGLHRVAHLAARSTGRVLYMTFANNLPRVQEQFHRRMSPGTAGRVDFTSLHGWALTFLAERGVKANLDVVKAETAFSLAWKRFGSYSALTEMDPSPSYWRDEIDYVIKGRGLASLEEYRLLARHGRRTALLGRHREAAWLLYEEYELLRAQKGVHDFNDVITMALKELRERPREPAYSAVVVDEVQDLSLNAVKMVHALGGDGPNGLLLIGDEQQAVYPGGFRLSEAGIDVKGRAVVLRTNYRNAAPILASAQSLIAEDSFDDLDGARKNGRQDVEAVHHDGRHVAETAATLTEHDQLMIDALRALHTPEGGSSAWADAAVLCATRRQIDYYQRLLTKSGIPVLRLEHYDGHPVPAVKLGTYLRAKGLEFKYVFLPYDTAPAPSDQERSELSRRRFYVGMTRARDFLWSCVITPPV